MTTRNHKGLGRLYSRCAWYASDEIPQTGWYVCFRTDGNDIESSVVLNAYRIVSFEGAYHVQWDGRWLQNLDGVDPHVCWFGPVLSVLD